MTLPRTQPARNWSPTAKRAAAINDRPPAASQSTDDATGIIGSGEFRCTAVEYATSAERQSAKLRRASPVHATRVPRQACPVEMDVPRQVATPRIIRRRPTGKRASPTRPMNTNPKRPPASTSVTMPAVRNCSARTCTSSTPIPRAAGPAAAKTRRIIDRLVMAALTPTAARATAGPAPSPGTPPSVLA